MRKSGNLTADVIQQFLNDDTRNNNVSRIKYII